MTNYMDERVLLVRRQIGSEMMQLVFYFVVISFCVKVLYFGMDLRECVTEYVIMIGVPIYQTIRSRQLGGVLGNYKKASKISTIISVAVGLGVLLLCLSRSSGAITTTEGIVSLVSFAAAFSLVRYAFARIEAARARKLEKEYDEE